MGSSIHVEPCTDCFGIPLLGPIAAIAMLALGQTVGLELIGAIASSWLAGSSGALSPCA